MSSAVMGQFLAEHLAPAYIRCDSHDWNSMDISDDKYQGKNAYSKTCHRCSTKRFYETKIPAEQMSMFGVSLASCC